PPATTPLSLHDALPIFSPNLRAIHLEELRRHGVDAEVDRDLFRAERRHKTAEEAAAIESAQKAAEAAVVEVVRELAKERSGMGSDRKSTRLNSSHQIIS